MDSQNSRMDELEKKLDAIYISVEKTRKYFQWTVVITVVVLVLPLIGLVFAIPSFLHNYLGAIDSLTSY